ncbi:Ras-related protein Rab-6B [Tritrichomonas foetus]|uniref:Ras-related protein Rab-6B n=1 Tax=Tritrichomonas foetus TaxID=1144522 RepID=A0A1J4JK02_9EUKA|nr:Ras-related protein Rab-6B [Tritrichomonas foetus]|eukprot:OHS98695.1 Ras-related protein Rab-6B [Tritrichomonas foetus]
MTSPIEESRKPDYLCRIVTCGEPSVGKTAILKRMLKGTFNQNEPPTIGSEYLHLDMLSQDKNVELQIWDTAGEERFRSLVPLYFRNSTGALLVFDQTSRHSFEQLDAWVDLYQQTNGDDALFFVVANKCDLTDSEMDQIKEEAYLWANHRGYPIYETSAKTGEGIDGLMSDISRRFIEKMENISKKVKRRNVGKDLELKSSNDSNCAC